MSSEEEIRAKQTELKVLPDDELMKLDVELWEREVKRQEAQAAGIMTGPDKDLMLHVAISREVNQRATAACWPWRRLFGGRKNCKKWLAHLERTQNAAKRITETVLGRTQPEAHGG